MYNVPSSLPNPKIAKLVNMCIICCHNFEFDLIESVSCLVGIEDIPSSHDSIVQEVLVGLMSL